MARPRSDDLRTRAAAVLEVEGLPRREVACAARSPDLPWIGETLRFPCSAGMAAA